MGSNILQGVPEGQAWGWGVGEIGIRLTLTTPPRPLVLSSLHFTSSQGLSSPLVHVTLKPSVRNVLRTCLGSFHSPLLPHPQPKFLANQVCVQTLKVR